MKKIGIYPGSFNPFHIGHQNIYMRALELFDEVHIVQAYNAAKAPSDNIFNQLGHEDNVWVFDGAITDFPKHAELEGKIEIFFIRGIRNADDYKYNSEQDYFLKTLDPEFRSVYLECYEGFKHVSSTAIRELKRLNKPYKHLIV